MTSQKRPYLFIIRNGPLWDITRLDFFARTFGSRFRGEVCTYGDEPGFDEKNGFEIRRYVLKGRRGPIARIHYLSKVVGRAVRKRWIDRERLVVVTYDPLYSGLMGVMIKWLTGARFICEVNGVYGEEDNLVDVVDPVARARKKRRMVRVADFVFRRADFVKLLFPEQLDGLRTPAAPRRDWFFNFIDDSLFQPQGLEPQQRLVFVGHPFLRKGGDIILDAWSRIRGDFPDWSLTLIGFQLEEHARAGEHPVEGVEFMVPQEASTLAAIIESSAALVLPSRSEAMGRVLIETAHLGRARIGSRVGGIPYYIEEGVDGLLFEPADSKSLEAVLRRFMSDPTLQEDLSRGALHRARTAFSSDEYLRRYGEIVAELTGWEAATTPPATDQQP